MSVRDENEYEDWLAEWADLESGLGIALSHPQQCQQLAQRVVQYDVWMQQLMQRDCDLGLYLLFQLACNSTVGYSASHALVCSVLCHLIASELSITGAQRNSLVRAALSMNLSMTALQDQLAQQNSSPSARQKNLIRSHAQDSALLLTELGVDDLDWLEVVQLHHHPLGEGDFAQLPRNTQLARILQLVDRYAAMISPRSSRSGHSASDSVDSVWADAYANNNPSHYVVAQALLRAVGLHPPGTYVQMDNQALAVVVRRSQIANLPWVAIVAPSLHSGLGKPEMHNTAQGAPFIKTALPASQTPNELDHYTVLRLAVQSI